jgi:hypothetical protein
MPDDTTPPPAPEPAKAAGDGKTFTQADLDRVVNDRLNRQRGQYADYDQIKSELAELTSANASDMEKAVAAARNEGRAEVQQAANIRLIQAEARALAAEARFRNPALAITTLDLSGIKVSDDGAVDAAAIKQLLADRATSDPYLVDDGKPATAPAGQAGIGAGGNPRTDFDPAAPADGATEREHLSWH